MFDIRFNTPGLTPLTPHKEIDLANPKANMKKTGFLRVERDWIDEVIELGYIDTFRHFYPSDRKYTWWSNMANSRQRDVGWRLDYFFVSSESIDKVTEAFILTDVQGSDHCPIGIKFKVNSFAEPYNIAQNQLEEAPKQLSFFD